MRSPASTENKVQEELKFATFYDPDETQLNTYFQTSEQDLLMFQCDEFLLVPVLAIFAPNTVTAVQFQSFSSLRPDSVSSENVSLQCVSEQLLSAFSFFHKRAI